MQKIYFILILLLFSPFLHAQDATLEELKAKKALLLNSLAPLQAQIDPIKAEIDAIDANIAKFPGWYKGVNGLLGFDLSSRNNWFAAGDLRNSSATTVKAGLNAYANNIQNKYFWRNAGGLSVGWQKLRLQENSDAKFEPIVDVLNLTSLFGYNIMPKLAVSTLGEYRTSIIENFNNPGYLDIGVGVTYTPINNLVFVLHPINYNYIFSQESTDFTSSLGCKIVGDYNAKLVKGINWRSNISGFLSYKNSDPALHNGTWTNWFNFNLYQGLGVAIEHGIRFSPQEKSLLNVSSNTQTYYALGLSYSI